MRIASLCSGIGGADLGWLLAGHEIVARAEADPFRRAVLAARFAGAAIVDRIAMLPAGTAHDVCYVDLPGAPDDLAAAWAEAEAFIRAAGPPWVLVECSPVRPFGRQARDLALLGYDLQFLHVTTRVATPSLSVDDQDVRRRALLFAGATAALARIAVPVTSINLTAQIGPLVARCAEDAEEQSRMLPRGWTCLCAERDTCACDGATRRVMVREATSPIMTLWAADVLTGGFAAVHEGGQYRRAFGAGTCVQAE
jgi:hypothetical protein